MKMTFFTLIVLSGVAGGAQTVDWGTWTLTGGSSNPGTASSTANWAGDAGAIVASQNSGNNFTAAWNGGSPSSFPANLIGSGGFANLTCGADATASGLLYTFDLSGASVTSEFTFAASNITASGYILTGYDSSNSVVSLSGVTTFGGYNAGSTGTDSITFDSNNGQFSVINSDLPAATNSQWIFLQGFDSSVTRLEFSRSSTSTIGDGFLFAVGSTVPEPSSTLLLGLGALGLLVRRKR